MSAYTVKHDDCNIYPDRKAVGSIVSFDHTYHGEKWVNRVCLRCKRHWYGPENAVREYSRAEWEEYVNEVA